MPVSPPTFRRADQRAKSARDRDHDQKREPWRNWYKLSVWLNLRASHLRKEPLCANCLFAHDDISAATVVHHKEPHRGDWAKFTDPENLESACKPCHDGEIQRGERAGWSDRGWQIEGHKLPPRVVQPLGLKPSAIPLTMVCGPPGAGKSTYIDARKGPEDIVIDIDAILQDISGEIERTQKRRDKFLLDAFLERNKRLSGLASETRPIAAWFIIGAPKPSMRMAWAEQLKPRDVVVLATSARLCSERIMAEPLRAATADGMLAGVNTWWDRYDSAACDTLCIKN